VKAVMRSLAREPRQLVGLMRLGLDARRAQSALRLSRSLLGEFFSLPELSEVSLPIHAETVAAIPAPA